MARSLLRSLVGGTHRVLVAQLVASVGVVAVAGWTLGVTSDLIRQRDRLRERVLVLEQAMSAEGIVVPPSTATVDQQSGASLAYPPEQTGAAAAAAADPGRGFDPSQIVVDLFTPAPPLRLVVLHARAPHDGAAATQLAQTLRTQLNLAVTVHVMAPGDPHQSGYAYYDGRQSQAAADTAASLNDLARDGDIAPWSAQLRGVALPARSAYRADRLDIVLPPLPQPAPAPPQIDPAARTGPPPS